VPLRRARARPTGQGAGCRTSLQQGWVPLGARELGRRVFRSLSKALEKSSVVSQIPVALLLNVRTSNALWFVLICIFCLLKLRLCRGVCWRTGLAYMEPIGSISFSPPPAPRFSHRVNRLLPVRAMLTLLAAQEDTQQFRGSVTKYWSPLAKKAGKQRLAEGTAVGAGVQPTAAAARFPVSALYQCRAERAEVRTWMHGRKGLHGKNRGQFHGQT